MQQTFDFEKNVLCGLKECGVNPADLALAQKTLGVAVSGGADSVSLLVSLCSICKNFSIPLAAVTVNHFIRADEETCGDVEYVKTLCKSLKDQGYDVSLTVCELKKGQVQQLSEAKGCGLESAARELRYKAFEDFINQNNISYLCLAHNKNDQNETILMKFLQGQGTGTTGIPPVRGKYIRPLLWTERSYIEEYLKQKNILWRTDSTNTDTAYLRNKIRNVLVPLLNTQFAGWDKSVNLGLEKNALDDECLEGLAKRFIKEHSNLWAGDSKLGPELQLDGAAFYALDRAIQYRVILAAFNELGYDGRVPYVFLRDICECADNYKEESSEKKGGGAAYKSFANLQVVLQKNKVCVKKTACMQNEIVFSDIIYEYGTYDFPWGQVSIPEPEPANGWHFPVLLRSWNSADTVKAADGTMRKVSDILSSWHVDQNLRQYIPVVQALDNPEQEILAVLGSCQGYKDWIVKK
ncbi:MAG: tRNA lysidine(34) synthetase TilS [Treponema sp.]|nr:tRNA lysidine(34) synthetase TilS [Treponema sp.]